MKQHVKSHREFGFSLVEVLAAMLVLGVGLIGVAKFQTKMTHESLLAKQQSEAINIAEAKLESLRFAYAIGDTANYQLSPYAEPERKQGTNTEYFITWDIMDDDNNKGQAELEVKVTWIGLGNKGKGNTEVLLKTIASDFDPNIQAKANYTAPPSVLVPEDIDECDGDSGDSTGSGDSSDSGDDGCTPPIRNAASFDGSSS